eukprot:TRINITY_DN17827_c0_g1_i1.p3 TRINITY_DN17827_c0_g1~~TRINITY_DN17827_c0_g1_i1.p3  ORF type:complete len:100 (+),score=34.63 TRINITY_DN17827_c0_g1_i1:325-624(+)
MHSPPANKIKPAALKKKLTEARDEIKDLEESMGDLILENQQLIKEREENRDQLSEAQELIQTLLAEIDRLSTKKPTAEDTAAAAPSKDSDDADSSVEDS